MDEKFIPYGVQYYRAPTPLEKDWAGDLENIRRSGFNTIKIWAQWRWNNPREGVYDFSDIEKLMKLSRDNDLKVIINVILDIAPAWFCIKYPESAMVKANQQKILPQVTAYRQIGGAPGPCYHHPQAIKAKNEFVAELAQKFSKDDTLLLWDLWNEPELTCGIAREAQVSDMVCYCGYSRKSFIRWLMQKYKSVDVLNGTWQRNYQNFDEVELPINPGSYRDMIDWRIFFADTLAEDLASRVKNIRAYDKKHKVMVHTVPPPYFNMINACCDDYKMVKHCDLFGNSIGSLPFPACLSVSAANGKTVINSEIHATGGSTFGRSGSHSYIEFKKHIFIPFAAGVKGFLYWQYRPERLGLESPAWGLTDIEGNRTDYLDYARQVNEIMQNDIDLIRTCKPRPSRIAIIKDNYNEIFTWCADGKTDKYYNSLCGAFNAFYRGNYKVDIITADQLVEQNLTSYRLIYYPLPYYMNRQVSEKLQNWIRNGGVFFSEAFLGAYCAENGLHSTKVPGYGFDKVFGVKEGAATTASAFVAAYGENWSIDCKNRDIVEIQYEDGTDRFDLKGYYFYEELLPESGKILASFSDGHPAIVENSFGKGKAIMAGTLVGAGYEITKDIGNVRLLKKLAGMAEVRPEVWIDRDNVRIDILDCPSGSIIIIINSSSEYQGRIYIKVKTDRIPQNIKDLEKNSLLAFAYIEGFICFEMNIETFDIRMLSMA